MPPLAEIYNPSPTLPSSLWHMLDAGSKIDPDSPAISVMHQSWDHFAKLLPHAERNARRQWLSWTYAELKHASLSLAAGMQDHGVKRGSVVATFINNGIENELLLWVSAILQLTLAPLDPGLLSPGRDDQLKDYITRLHPQTVVVSDASAANAMDDVLARYDIRTETKVTLEKSANPGWTPLESLAVAFPESDEEPSCLAQKATLEDSGKRVALVLFTSGTSTGRPKGCPLTVRGMLNGAVNDMAFADLPSTLIMQNVNFRVICPAMSLSAFRKGGHVVMPGPAFSPKQCLDTIEQCRAELVVCIPVMIQAIARDPLLKSRNLDSLRQVVLGGDMATEDVMSKAQEIFPNAHITTGHGMSEGFGTLGWLVQGLGQPIPSYGSIMSVGAPAPGTLARICADDGTVLQRGEAGQLHLGGPSMIEHYLGNVQPDLFYRDEHGSWVLTGDRAVMDEGGRIFILGRIKDIIKKTGISLSPAVIESVLNKHTGIEVYHILIENADLCLLMDAGIGNRRARCNVW